MIGPLKLNLWAIIYHDIISVYCREKLFACNDDHMTEYDMINTGNSRNTCDVEN